LSQIKKKHDEAKKLGNIKQDELEKVRKEIAQLEIQEAVAEPHTHEMQAKLEMLEESLGETRYKIEEEQFTKHSYLHMLDRMKKDFIASKIASSENELSLKNKVNVLNSEESKQRKIKEERLQSKAIFDSLMNNINKQQEDRQERIKELMKCIKNKEDSVQKRIDRQKRNQEIAEAAANENKDSSEIKMRENLYIQKLWNSFMRKKMEKEMMNSSQIDDAFKQIKTATGVTDVQEMVKKFLTREQTYSQLLVKVSEFERGIENLKTDNDTLRDRLHNLKIDSQATQDNNDDTGISKFNDEELIEMNNSIQSQKKEYSILGDKYKKVNIVNDQISGWAKRVYSKFAALTNDPSLQQQPDDIVKVFLCMDQIVSQELTTLKERPDYNQIEPDDPFIDHCTEEFKDKNIRVRPISGITHDETKDGRQSNVSKGAGEGEDNNMDNQEMQANYDITMQREMQKKKYLQHVEEMRKKQAAEEKKANKK